MKSERKYQLFVGPLFLMALIFVESSIPMDGGPGNIQFLTDLDPNLQNLLHIPLYGLLAYLWLRAFHALGLGLWQTIVLSLLITIGYGGFDEVHQSFVPGRYAGLLDICLNTTGALMASAWFYFRKLMDW